MKNLKKFKFKDFDAENRSQKSTKGNPKKKASLKNDKSSRVKNKKQFYNDIYEEE